MAGLEEFKKYRPKAQWIGDTTDIGVIGQEDKDWIDKEWYPQFLATGVSFMAVVQPKTAIARISVDSIVAKIPGTGLTIFNCVTLKEAREWMMKQKF